MNIAGDIVDEILTRLPVKSLVRFKVVCKEWYFTIQSSFFIEKHMKHHTTNKKALIYHNQLGRLNLLVSICSEEGKNDEDDDTSLTLFHQDQQYPIQEMPLDYFRYCEDNTRPDDHYDFVHIFSAHMSNAHQLHYLKSVPLHLLNSYSEVQVVDTCNGLVCLDYTDWNKDEIAYNRITTLWNPATRDFKTLPSLEPQRHTRELALRNLRVRDHIGFGFDCTSNDYKVIRVVYRLEKKSIDQAMIYSLNTNSWKELDYSNVSAEIGLISICGSTIFLCEKVYWVILSHDAVGNLVLLSFDMGIEVFQLTPLPSDFIASVKTLGEVVPEFFTFHNSIALVPYGRRGTSGTTLVIWTTKELEQGRDSWIKVLHIDLVSEIARPLGFWKCKRSNDYLFLFIYHTYGESDCNKNRMKGIYINNRGELKDDNVMTIKVEDNIVLPLKVASYVETLVPANRP